MLPRRSVAGFLDAALGHTEFAHVILDPATGTNLPHRLFGQFRGADPFSARNRPMLNGIIGIALWCVPAKILKMVVPAIAISVASPVLSNRRLSDKSKKDR